MVSRRKIENLLCACKFAIVQVAHQRRVEKYVLSATQERRAGPRAESILSDEFTLLEVSVQWRWAMIPFRDFPGLQLFATLALRDLFENLTPVKRNSTLGPDGILPIQPNRVQNFRLVIEPIENKIMRYVKASIELGNLT